MPPTVRSPPRVTPTELSRNATMMAPCATPEIAPTVSAAASPTSGYSAPSITATQPARLIMLPTERSNSRAIMVRPSPSATGPMVASCCSTLNAVARLTNRPWPQSTRQNASTIAASSRNGRPDGDVSLTDMASPALAQRVQHDDAEHDQPDDEIQSEEHT